MRKYWNDPDNGECSQLVEVVRSDGELSSVCNEHGTQFQVLSEELSDPMPRERALLIVWELANENRLTPKDCDSDEMDVIRREHDEAFALLEADPLQ